MNANLQNLLNEREHADSEGRRRLESRAENLESEVKTLKRKVQEEQEEHKRLSMRREHEMSQSQTRIDDLLSSLSSAREELAAAKTARDHLQTRVDELAIELRGAVEKLDVLQQRPAPSADSGEVLQPNDSSVTKEQELAMQVAELKKSLELVQAELVSARQQVDQYKAISSSSEEELRNFNETHEQYRQEMDKIVIEMETRIKSQEQDLDNLRAELSARNAELDEVQVKEAQSEHRFQEQKASYETEIAKLQDLRERAESAAQYHQEDLKSQAEIAQQAQQNYENELLKHAEAAKALQAMRSEYHEMKIKNVEILANAETAEAKLAQNEESWAEARDRYERELTEMRRRKEDLGAQNRILHEQLESLGKQITGLQKSNALVADESESATTSNNSDVANLQELVRYLRREKDIVDVQHDLASQEARRLRQQLEHKQSQLEETRLKLSQQRRSEETSELHALSHKKLIDTINELNLNRESNSTLRTEKTQLQTLLNERSQQIEELQNQLMPLQARISELEDQHEALAQELRMTKEARERFEQRYNDILNRSNSVDPAEFERLQQYVQTLESERDTLTQSTAELQSQIDTMPSRIQERLDEATKNYQETRQKLVEQSKNRDMQQKSKIKEKETALQEALQEKGKLEAQVREVRTDLDKVRQDYEAQITRIQDEDQAKLQAQAELFAQQLDDAKQSASKAAQSPGGDKPAESTAVSDSSPQLQELQKKIEAAESQATAANTKVKELEERAVCTTGYTSLGYC